MGSLIAQLRRPYSGLVLTGLAALACLAMLDLLPGDTLRAWTLEGGFFEIGSVVGYCLAAAACLLMLRREPGLFGMSAVLLLLLGAREMDLHKAFTADSLLKSHYYLKTAAPLLEKLIAAGVVLAILALVAIYAWRYAGRLRRSLRERSSVGISVAAFLGLMVFTKLIDRLPNILKDDFGLNVAAGAIQLQMALEEPLEFCIPLLAILAVYQAYAGSPLSVAEVEQEHHWHGSSV